MIYAQQKQYDKAKQALEMAIRTHPSYATAHENLGDIYARLASQAYDKALQIDSSNTSAQTKLAMIRDLMGNSGRRKRQPVAAAKPTRVAAAEPQSRRHQARARRNRSTASRAEPAKPVEAQTGAKPSRPKPSPPSTPATKAPGDADAEVTRPSRAGPRPGRRRTSRPTSAYYAKRLQDARRRIPRQAWETERTQRIDKPGAIRSASRTCASRRWRRQGHRQVSASTTGRPRSRPPAPRPW